jgi:protein TonB
MLRRWIPAVAVLLLAGFSDARAQVPSMPAASGRTLDAQDGDLIVVPSTASVTIVRRSQVQARLLYIPAQQTILLFSDPPFGFGERLADAKGFRRWQLMDPWPLEPRWEGSATIDEYLPGPQAPLGVAIHIDRGTVVLGSMGQRDVAFNPPPLAVVRTGAMSARVAQGTFDEIERAWLSGGDEAVGGRAFAQLRASAGSGTIVAGPASGSASWSAAGVPGGAVRVGGNIRPPERTHRVDPVYPETARAAGVQGVVILEAVIGEDGAVASTRVLRSIPMLDAAALEAVKQWRYAPTLVNGVPTSVIMTVTVNFHLPPSTP